MIPLYGAVARLVASWRICPVNQEALDLALNLPVSDFEDAVQVASAVLQGVTGLWIETANASVKRMKRPRNRSDSRQ